MRILYLLAHGPWFVVSVIHNRGSISTGISFGRSWIFTLHCWYAWSPRWQ